MANNDASNYVDDQELAARLSTGLDEENGGGWGLPLSLGGVGGGILGFLAALAGKRFFRGRQVAKDKKAVEALARSIKTLTGLNTDTSGKTAGEYVRTLNPEQLETVANNKQTWVNKLARDKAKTADNLRDVRALNKNISERATAERARSDRDRLDYKIGFKLAKQGRDMAVEAFRNSHSRAMEFANKSEELGNKLIGALERNRLYETQLENARGRLYQLYARELDRSTHSEIPFSQLNGEFIDLLVKRALGEE